MAELFPVNDRMHCAVSLAMLTCPGMNSWSCDKSAGAFAAAVSTLCNHEAKCSASALAGEDLRRGKMLLGNLLMSDTVMSICSFVTSHAAAHEISLPKVQRVEVEVDTRLSNWLSALKSDFDRGIFGTIVHGSDVLLCQEAQRHNLVIACSIADDKHSRSRKRPKATKMYAMWCRGYVPYNADVHKIVKQFCPPAPLRNVMTAPDPRAVDLPEIASTLWYVNQHGGDGPAAPSHVSGSARADGANSNSNSD